MNCSISGEICEEPVISKNGHIFEKRLIEKHIKETGKCPVTEQDLTNEDLIPVQNSDLPVRPRPASATSLASLLKLFQNEWDAIMLETYTLKQQLDTTRKELSLSLYQHDAACRVIARLKKERDDAQAALSDTQENMKKALAKSGIDSAETEMKDEDEGLTSSVIEEMTTCAKTLSKNRKKMRKQPQNNNLANVEEITKFSVLSSHPLHLTSNPGISCLDLSVSEPNLCVTGGFDASLILFNRETKKIVQTLKKHTKKVSCVQFHPNKNVILSSSFDHSSIIWSFSEKSKNYIPKHISQTHSDSVTSLSLQPTGNYYVTCSNDLTWAFHDLESGKCLKHVKFTNSEDKNSVIKSSLNQIQFHPDGLILGTGGSDNLVRIWDIKQQTNMAVFEGHSHPISAMSFSENGYYLATGDESGVVKLWDLRKLLNFKSFNVSKQAKNTSLSQSVYSLNFDLSGQYLAVGGNGLFVYESKNFEVVKQFDEHRKEVTGVRIAKNAQFFVSCSLDRNLKFYGMK